MKNKKPHWVVSVYQGDTSRGIETMVLCFRLSYEKDAAEQTAQALHFGLSEDVKIYMELADKLRKATGSTRYYGVASFSDHFELRCQRNLGEVGNCWYGLRLRDGALTVRVARAIAKLARVDEPNEAIAILKANHVSYCEPAGEYVTAERPAILGELPGKLKVA
jgi:hypothetical protein